MDLELAALFREPAESLGEGGCCSLGIFHMGKNGGGAYCYVILGCLCAF